MLCDLTSPVLWGICPKEGEKEDRDSSSAAVAACTPQDSGTHLGPRGTLLTWRSDDCG